jgi:hypothetical protein
VNAPPNSYARQLTVVKSSGSRTATAGRAEQIVDHRAIGQGDATASAIGIDCIINDPDPLVALRHLTGHGLQVNLHQLVIADARHRGCLVMSAGSLLGRCIMLGI